MMDRGTELALKRAVREGLATRLQGDFDPVEVESAIQSLVQEAVRAGHCLVYTSDAADEEGGRYSGGLRGRRKNKKKWR